MPFDQTALLHPEKLVGPCQQTLTITACGRAVLSSERDRHALRACPRWLCRVDIQPSLVGWRCDEPQHAVHTRAMLETTQLWPSSAAARSVPSRNRPPLTALDGRARQAFSPVEESGGVKDRGLRSAR